MPRTLPTLVSLRADLKAKDPHRPCVDRMPRGELECILTHIAEGGATFPHPDHVEPMGAFRGFDFRAEMAPFGLAAV